MLSKVLGASGRGAAGRRADSAGVQLTQALLPADYQESSAAAAAGGGLQGGTGGTSAVPAAVAGGARAGGSQTGGEQMLTPTAADAGNELFPLQSPLFVASPTLPPEHLMSVSRPPRPLHGQGSDRASQTAGLAMSPPEGGALTLPHSQSVMRASAQLQAAFSVELQEARRATRSYVESGGSTMQAAPHQQAPTPLLQQSSHPQPPTQPLHVSGAAAASARYLHMAQSLRASMGAGSPGGPGYFSEASPAGQNVTAPPGHTYGHTSHSSRRPPALDLPSALTSGGTSGAGQEEHHRAL
jgi:hypothetical protein